MVAIRNYWLDSCAVSDVQPLRNVDVVIIGGGIAGILVLYHLIHSGTTNVVLLEEDEIGLHATGRGGGQLLLKGGTPFSKANNPDYLKFVINNNRILKKYIRAHAEKLDLVESGGLHIASTPEQMELLKQEASYINQNSNIECQILDYNDIKTVIPSDKFLGGIFIPTECLFNPFKLMAYLCDSIYKSGNYFICGAPVEAVTKSGDFLTVSVKNKGTIRTKTVVYCTNSYSCQLLPELTNFLTPFRGQMLASEPLAKEIINYFPITSMTFNDYSESVRFHNNRILVGGMRRSVKGHQENILYDREVSPTVSDRLRNFVSSSFSSLTGAKFTHVWSGIMAQTFDGMPFIGIRPNCLNEYMLLGFNGYGFSQALGGARVISEMIKGKKINNGFCDPWRILNAKT